MSAATQPSGNGPPSGAGRLTGVASDASGAPGRFSLSTLRILRVQVRIVVGLMRMAPARSGVSDETLRGASRRVSPSPGGWLQAEQGPAGAGMRPGRSAHDEPHRHRHRVWLLDVERRNAVLSSSAAFCVCVGISMILAYVLARFFALWMIGPVN
jgi:hypothetical protein